MNPCWNVIAKVVHQRHVALAVQKKLQSDCVVWTLHILVLFHVHRQLQSVFDSYETTRDPEM